jgi:hypothetical protein
MKVYTQEEALDLMLGKKGTPLRDKYEAKVKRYLTGLLKRKIEREGQYKAALKRVEELMLQLPEGTLENDPDMKELTMLGNLVADYEEKHYPIDD